MTTDAGENDRSVTRVLVETVVIFNLYLFILLSPYMISFVPLKRSVIMFFSLV